SCTARRSRDKLFVSKHPSAPRPRVNSAPALQATRDLLCIRQRRVEPGGCRTFPLRQEYGDDKRAILGAQRSRSQQRRIPEFPATPALQASRTRDIVPPMSTADLISELQALSPRERARVIRAIIPAMNPADRVDDK